MAIKPALIGSEPFTFRDLEGMPDDGRLYELSNGALIVTPGPNTRHQGVVSRLFRLLDDHRLPSQEILVEAELLVRDDTVKRPDLQVVDRSLIGGQHIAGIPALVVEVGSPSTAIFDRTEKREVYESAGIPAYWMVDPDAETVTVLELVDGVYVEIATLMSTGRCDVTVPTAFELEAALIFG